MSGNDYDEMAQKLAETVESQLGVSAKGGLAHQLRRIGRRAPRWVRRNVRIVAEAEDRARDPRLLGRIAAEDVARAYDQTMGWLKDRDPEARRRQALRGVLAGLAFNVLLAGGLGIAALAWLGLIGPGAR